VVEQDTAQEYSSQPNVFPMCGRCRELQKELTTSIRATLIDHDDPRRPRRRRSGGGGSTPTTRACPHDR
jgi:hypothetical protein